MARRLFTVEDTFSIRGRGLVLVPGIVPEGDERFRVGDRITLRRPDGSSIDTQIGGLELLDPNPRHDVVIMLRGLARQTCRSAPRSGRPTPNLDTAQQEIAHFKGGPSVACPRDDCSIGDRADDASLIRPAATRGIRPEMPLVAADRPGKRSPITAR